MFGGRITLQAAPRGRWISVGNDAHKTPPDGQASLQTHSAEVNE